MSRRQNIPHFFFNQYQLFMEQSLHARHWLATSDQISASMESAELVTSSTLRMIRFKLLQILVLMNRAVIQ